VVSFGLGRLLLYYEKPYFLKLFLAKVLMKDPIIVSGLQARSDGQQSIAADGRSFGIFEWRGSGPDYLHVHYSDDEAWDVLEGTLTFRFSDRQVDASAGTTVFVPAGVPHSYRVAGGPARYLIILTPGCATLSPPFRLPRGTSITPSCAGLTPKYWNNDPRNRYNDLTAFSVGRKK
jgi:uncharacterized cupin superfamily protein